MSEKSVKKNTKKKQMVTRERVLGKTNNKDFKNSRAKIASEKGEKKVKTENKSQFKNEQ